MIIEGKEIFFKPQFPIPYFQVTDEYRIRFGFEVLDKKRIQEVIEYAFQINDDITVELKLRSYIDNKEIRERTNMNRYFTINNWEERIVEGYVDPDYPDDIDKFMMVKVKHIQISEILKYAKSAIRNYKREVFIHFYTEHVDVFVHEDVIDIVSHDRKFIEDFKVKYEGIYDTYWVGRPNDE